MKEFKETYGKNLVAVFDIPTFDNQNTQSLVITLPSPLEVVSCGNQKNTTGSFQVVFGNVQVDYQQMSLKSFFNELIFGKNYTIFLAIMNNCIMYLNKNFVFLFRLIYEEHKILIQSNIKGFEQAVREEMLKISSDILHYSLSEKKDNSQIYALIGNDENTVYMRAKRVCAIYDVIINGKDKLNFSEFNANVERMRNVYEDIQMKLSDLSVSLIKERSEHDNDEVRILNIISLEILRAMQEAGNNR